MNPAIQVFDDHLRLSVRLIPNGGRDRLDGFETNAANEAYLKARVTAVPENGRANKALNELVAKSLRHSEERRLAHVR